MIYQIVSESLEDTKKFAKKLAKDLKTPMTILLEGEMGAGKTAFSKAFIEEATGDMDSASPTYTLVNCYEGDQKRVYHFDLYRLSDPDELYEMGFDDYLDDPQAYLLIEWPDMACLDKTDALTITIQPSSSPDKRLFCFQGEDRLIKTVKELLTDVESNSSCDSCSGKRNANEE